MSNQNFGSATAVSSSGTITAVSQTVVLGANGSGGFGILITGTWVGTIDFEGSVDGTTWVALRAASPNSPIIFIEATASNGTFTGVCGGLLQIRVNSSAWTSGTANIELHGTPTRGMDAETNVVGNVAHGTVDVGPPIKTGGKATTGTPTGVSDGERVDGWYDPFGRQNVQLTADAVPASDDLVKKEDDASAGGDAGITIYSVRRTTPVGSAGTAGDYQQIESDDSGRLYVNSVLNDGAGTLAAFGGGVVTSNTLRTVIADDGLIRVEGNVDHDLPDTLGPVKIGGRARNTAIAAVAENDRVDAIFTLEGAQVVAGTSATGAPKDFIIDTSGGLFVGGDDTHSSTDVGRPVKIGGRARTSAISALSNDQRSDQIMSTTGGALGAGAAAGVPTNFEVSTGGHQLIAGDVAHDDADAGSPVKVGHKAISHGADPAEVAANDRTHLYADRQGMPFGMLGHPNVIVREYMTTAVQTGDEIIAAVGAAQRVVVLQCEVFVSHATTPSPQVRIGFGTTGGVPAEPASGASTTGLVLSHPGIAPGSGVIAGMAGARIAEGGLGQELGIANAVPTDGKITVIVRYYIIDE